MPNDNSSHQHDSGTSSAPLIRYEYTDADDEGCPTFVSHTRQPEDFFLQESIGELEGEGWKVLRYARCQSKDQPSHRLNWKKVSE